MNSIHALLGNAQYTKANISLIRALHDNTYVFHPVFIKQQHHILPFLHYKALHYGLTAEEIQKLNPDIMEQFVHYPLCRDAFITHRVNPHVDHLGYESHGEPFNPWIDHHSLIFDIENTPTITHGLMLLAHQKMLEDPHYFDGLSLDGRQKVTNFFYSHHDENKEAIPFFFHLMQKEVFRKYVKNNYTLPIQMVPNDGHKYTCLTYPFTHVIDSPYIQELILKQPHYLKKVSKQDNYSLVVPTDETLTFIQKLYNIQPDFFNKHGISLYFPHRLEKHQTSFSQWEECLRKFILQAELDDQISYKVWIPEMKKQLEYIEKRHPELARHQVHITSMLESVMTMLNTSLNTTEEMALHM